MLFTRDLQCETDLLYTQSGKVLLKVAYFFMAVNKQMLATVAHKNNNVNTSFTLRHCIMAIPPLKQECMVAYMGMGCCIIRQDSKTHRYALTVQPSLKVIIRFHIN